MRTALVLPTLLALLACHPTPAEPVPADEGDPSTPVVEPDAGKPVRPGKPVKLSPFETQISVPVGTTLLRSFESHASVGYGASQHVGDASVVRYVRTDEDYEQSEKQRAGKTGADAATGTFVFEAVGVGTTTVRVDEEFRGSVENSSTYTITVTAK